MFRRFEDELRPAVWMAIGRLVVVGAAGFFLGGIKRGTPAKVRLSNLRKTEDEDLCVGGAEEWVGGLCFEGLCVEGLVLKAFVLEALC